MIKEETKDKIKKFLRRGIIVLVIFNILLVMLSACGKEQVNLVPKEEKISIVKKALYENDEKALDVYSKKIIELENQSKKNITGAKEELEEWTYIYSGEKTLSQYKVNTKANLKNH